MRIPVRSFLAVLAVAAVAMACTPQGSNGPGGVSRPIGGEPLGDDEVTLHMAQPPELPSPLEGADVTAAELRSADLTDRNTVQLVDIPAEVSTLDDALPPGAVLRVRAGQGLEVSAEVDVAVLDPDASDDTPGVVQEVRSPCDAPCTLEGPALIAPEGWMTGFGVSPTWLLLVPSPVS